MTGDGKVFAYGDAVDYGEIAWPITNRIVGMAASPAGNGYWLLTDTGGIFQFGGVSYYGAAQLHGSGDQAVDIENTGGNGYWIVTKKGGVFSFGNAVFRGSLGSGPLGHPIVAVARTPTANGYWLLADDGGVFAFGDATFYGAATVNGDPAVDIAARPDGTGYWIVTQDGVIHNKAAAVAFGSVVSTKDAVGAVAQGNNGLWVATQGNGPPADGDLAGLVTDDTGAPAIGICVVAYGDTGYGYAPTRTSSTGWYHIGRVNPGDYQIQFDDCGAGATRT